MLGGEQQTAGAEGGDQRDDADHMAAVETVGEDADRPLEGGAADDGDAHEPGDASVAELAGVGPDRRQAPEGPLGEA
ncbi:hypothetical protein SDC9_192260 [bioreactor metagenome]|uniref:Uncharacterized protein n=1 Tax=bioreactor metagenome TaxID=1076179 RepID=A0A645I097_9ZZZZ